MIKSFTDLKYIYAVNKDHDKKVHIKIEDVVIHTV